MYLTDGLYEFLHRTAYSTIQVQNKILYLIHCTKYSILFLVYTSDVRGDLLTVNFPECLQQSHNMNAHFLYIFGSLYLLFIISSLSL